MSEPQISVLIDAASIHVRVQEMAHLIARDMPKDLLVVALLRGSFVFAADLLRALHAAGAKPQVDFMTVSSYGAGTTSSGSITVHRDLSEPVEGRHILLVDDILESGNTLHFAREAMRERGAASIHIAVLLEKPGKLKRDIKADAVGFTIPDQFVVGYGLDHAGYWRELPFIGCLVP